MKTVFAASALLLVANVASADAWEQAWQNPDLGTGVYDKPVTLVEPMASSSDTTASLDVFNRGNPDHAAHGRPENSGRGTQGFASSLDAFNEGNPDHV